MSNRFDLERFRDAQAPVMDTVMTELRAGRKRTHWMWYVFPQLAALGQSITAKHYGIASLDEARAYMEDPILQQRLVACATCVLAISDKSLNSIFGGPDDLKFVSSMTLFATAVPTQPVFRACLDKYCNGRLDAATIEYLYLDPQ